MKFHTNSRLKIDNDLRKPDRKDCLFSVEN